MAIVEFLSFASKELERRPRDVEEVGLAHEAHARIEQQSAGIAEEMQVVAVLAKVMAAWTSEKLDGNISPIYNTFVKFFPFFFGKLVLYKLQIKTRILSSCSFYTFTQALTRLTPLGRSWGIVWKSIRLL